MKVDKLRQLANQITDINTLRLVFAELNYDYKDVAISKDGWTSSLKADCIDARIIADKNGYKIAYVRTNSNKMSHWKGVATAIIKQYHGMCIVCSHTPDAFKWIFSSLSAEFTPKFTETRHVPIEIRPGKPAPNTFVRFLDLLRVKKSSPPVTIARQVSNAFDSFAVSIHDELTVNVFEALKVLSKGLFDDTTNNLTLDDDTLEEIRVPVFIMLYRIMFILYVEDRSIFPNTSYYHENLSLRWLKENWVLKKPKNLAPYQVHARLRRLFKLIEIGSEDAGYDPDKLFMRPYYGRLFDRKLYSRLEEWNISNESLLATIELLTTTKDKKNKFLLDYAALETRHLGAIYEHLLEYHLTVADGKIADLPNGIDRKLTGSYYTPLGLVSLIVQNTVGPLIDAIVADTPDPSDQIDKILELNILDPSMGSGHFLVGVINYMARRICEIESSGDIIDDKLIERKRDVARRCIYGVDINPLAVDLAQVSIWLETISIDKPLSFLSAHLKSGNSLIGTSLSSILDKQTRLQENLGDRLEFKKTIRNFLSLESLDDDTADAVRTKVTKFNNLLEKGTVYYNLKFLLNAQSAKLFGIDVPAIYNYSLVGENTLDYHFEGSVLQSIKALSARHLFFHYELEFPDVFYNNNGQLKPNPGFDAVIGNPPWEIIKPDTEEFFAPIYDQEHAHKFRKLSKLEKNNIVNELLKNPLICKNWYEYKEQFKILSSYFSNSNYTYQTSRKHGERHAGDLNLFKLFFERSFSLVKQNGRCGLIVPAGIYSDSGCRGLRQMLFQNTQLGILDSFINTSGIFKSVHKQYKFCVVCYTKGGITDSFLARFYLTSVDELSSTKSFNYPLELVKQYSPTTMSVVQFQNENALEIFRKLYLHPRLSEEPWNLCATRELDMTNSSGLFNTKKRGYVLYEGKMVYQFFNNLVKPTYYVDISKADQYLKDKEAKRIKKLNPLSTIQPRLDHEDYRLVWRDVTNAVDRRTLIVTIVPPSVLLGNTLSYVRPFIFDGHVYKPTLSHDALAYLCGILNSFPIDYILRHRVNLHVSIFHFNELPVPLFDRNNPYHKLISKNASILLAANDDFLNFCHDVGMSKVDINPDDQIKLQAQINVAVCKVTNITKNELSHILKSFRVENDLLKNLTLAQFDCIDQVILDDS